MTRRPHVPGRICHSLTNLSTDVSRQYVLCFTAYPCRTHNGKRHAATPHTKRGHKGANKLAGRLSPNPPTPLTHEGEISWTESVPVTCQHGARVLSHANLRGGPGHTSIE